MNKKLLKSCNSKSALASAIIVYQRALSHYADENNWAVKPAETELVGAVGKLMLDAGEEFRLNHPELCAAYRAALEKTEIIWLGDDDPTYAAQVSLAQRKADYSYDQRNRPVTGHKTKSK